MEPANKVESTSTLSRAFNYSSNGVVLNFSLRVDVKEELVAFAQLLEKALTDVKAEIEK